jgi:hypothetical protein
MNATTATILPALTAILYAVVTGLASYRVWRLVGHDEITEPWLWGPLRRNPHPVSQFLDTLITCAWCLGFWINGAITTALWLWTPLFTHWWEAAILTFAGSAVTGILGSRDMT